MKAVSSCTVPVTPTHHEDDDTQPVLYPLSNSTTPFAQSAPHSSPSDIEEQHVDAEGTTSTPEDDALILRTRSVAMRRRGWERQQRGNQVTTLTVWRVDPSQSSPHRAKSTKPYSAASFSILPRYSHSTSPTKHTTMTADT